MREEGERQLEYRSREEAEHLIQILESANFFPQNLKLTQCPKKTYLHINPDNN